MFVVVIVYDTVNVNKFLPDIGYACKEDVPFGEPESQQTKYSTVNGSISAEVLLIPEP